MIVKILDILRIVLVGVAFYVGYQIGFDDNTYDAKGQLHVMIPIVIVAVAGFSGIEGLLFGKQAALAKGYEVGSNYQKQSAIALLSYAFMAIWVFFAQWGIMAELTILFTFLFFFFFSAVNHTIDAIKNKNYKWQNINRPFILLMLIAGFIYPVYMVFAR